MILIESPGPVPPIYIKYMNEEGFKVSDRPILVLTCFCLKVYWESKLPKFRHERTKAYEVLTTMLYLGNRLVKSIQTFFILKVWTRRFPKLEPNESSSSHILVFKLNNQFNIS